MPVIHVLHNDPVQVPEIEGWITRSLVNEVQIPHYRANQSMSALFHKQSKWCPFTLVMVVTTNTTVFQRPPFTNCLQSWNNPLILVIDFSLCVCLHACMKTKNMQSLKRIFKPLRTGCMQCMGPTYNHVIYSKLDKQLNNELHHVCTSKITSVVI